VSAQPRCCELSEQAGEALTATATTVEHWLLVETGGTWPRDVGDADGLPERVREAAGAWLDTTPSSRLLYIRRPGRGGSGRPLAFVVHAGEVTRSVRRLELASHGNSHALDFAVDGEPIEAPLVLVCGHGTRDACCALRGNAVYGALGSDLGADELWLSSHQGGHRFAANVLVLPDALQFGRVAAGEARAVVGGALAGRIALDRYRGRTAYPQAVQAAEQAVRATHRLDATADLRLVDVHGGRVRFTTARGADHVVEVEEDSGPAVPASCGAEAAPQLAFAARLV
jgi:hypothetical protein